MGREHIPGFVEFKAIPAMRGNFEVGVNFLIIKLCRDHTTRHHYFESVVPETSPNCMKSGIHSEKVCLNHPENF